MYIIFPDIHGQYEKLEHQLRKTGFVLKNGAWQHPTHTALFLGDFIDRGTRNGDVLNTVRGMIDRGSAMAVMGNHELNALFYHTDAHNGDGLRVRDAKNTKQHAAFLAEFPLGAPETQAQLDFIKTLPLALDLPDTRAVHACWDQASLDVIKDALGNWSLEHADFHACADLDTDLGKAIEQVTKGPELALPPGYGVHDKEGTRRTRIRAKWWEHATTWDSIAMSVVNPSELPEGEATLAGFSLYPTQATPVFFGHYWLTGTPAQQSHNALCLDYSAGLEGPLLGYRHEGGPITMDNILYPD